MKDDGRRKRAGKNFADKFVSDLKSGIADGLKDRIIGSEIF